MVALYTIQFQSSAGSNTFKLAAILSSMSSNDFPLVSVHVFLQTQNKAGKYRHVSQR